MLCIVAELLAGGHTFPAMGCPLQAPHKLPRPGAQFVKHASQGAATDVLTHTVSGSKLSVGSRIQWVQAVSGCKHSVGASCQWFQVFSRCKLSVRASCQWGQAFSGCKLSVCAICLGTAHTSWPPAKLRTKDGRRASCPQPSQSYSVQPAGQMIVFFY